MTESWLPVPGFETSYLVSDQGRVKSLSRTTLDGRPVRERILKPSLNSAGRQLILLQKDRRKRCCHVYQLVAEAFIGPRPDKHCVNHRNGICTDDRLVNLEYTTPKENSQHAVHVLNSMARGEKHGRSKLSPISVKDIRSLWATGEWKQRDIAQRYGVSQRAIWQVIHRITWAHID